MFVTTGQIETLTGYKLRSAQRRWLTEHGWKFEVDRYGKPQVHTAEMERKMVGKNPARTRELNLGAIRAGANG